MMEEKVWVGRRVEDLETDALGKERGWGWHLVYERADHEIAWVALLAPSNASNHCRCTVICQLPIDVLLSVSTLKDGRIRRHFNLLLPSNFYGSTQPKIFFLTCTTQLLLANGDRRSRVRGSRRTNSDKLLAQTLSG